MWMSPARSRESAVALSEECLFSPFVGQVEVSLTTYLTFILRPFSLVHRTGNDSRHPMSIGRSIVHPVWGDRLPCPGDPPQMLHVICPLRPVKTEHQEATPGEAAGLGPA